MGRPLLPTARAAALGVALPAIGTSDLQQTLPLIYVILALSIVGAGLTWGFLAYALWKFRDPATKGRKYG